MKPRMTDVVLPPTFEQTARAGGGTRTVQVPTLHQHVAVKSNVTDLAASISGIVKLRLDPVTAPLVGNEEGNLLAALASLQWLCSEIRTVNDNLTSPDAALDLIRPVMAEEVL